MIFDIELSGERADEGVASSLEEFQFFVHERLDATECGVSYLGTFMLVDHSRNLEAVREVQVQFGLVRSEQIPHSSFAMS
jgi:hypothetical protein